MAATPIRLAHDLQIDPADARPYLPKSYYLVVGAFYAIVLGGLFLMGVWFFQQKSIKATKAAKDQQSAMYVQQQSESGVKVAALKEQAGQAALLRKWTSLNTPMQTLYLDVVGTLGGNILLTELTVRRSKAEPRIRLEIGFAAEQTQATQQFQRTLDALLQKGYRTVSVDQSNFTGGVKFTSELVYPQRGDVQ